MDELDARRQQHEAQVLEALARSLNAALDLDTVLQAIVAGARDLCGSDIQKDREQQHRVPQSRGSGRVTSEARRIEG